MESPCIKICVMDPASSLCRGCGRTLTEIAVWSSMTDGERQAIMEKLAERIRVAGLESAASPAALSRKP